MRWVYTPTAIRVLQKAFNKYPAKVIKDHLKAIYFAGVLDDGGLNYGGTYDPFRKIIYLINDGQENDDKALYVFHHEFSSLLLKSHSFREDPWIDNNPETFKYLREKYNWKTLLKKVDTLKEGSEQDYKKGFIRIYGQIDFENDFNEYSGMILTYPEKFKKLMDKYPRVRGKFQVWLEFYHEIDPIFTEEYLFGKAVQVKE